MRSSAVLLQDAADNSRLTSNTYQVLSSSVLLKSCGYLGAFLASSQLWTPALAALYPTSALASVVTAVLVNRATNGTFKLPELVFEMPKNAVSWTYSVFVLLYLATAAACFAPEVLFIGKVTPLTQFLKFTWAPGFLLGALSCYVLKSAADRGRLGASTFKRLNQGLASLEMVYSLLLGSAIVNGLAVDDVSSWSNLAGSVSIALFCGYQAVTAKK